MKKTIETQYAPGVIDPYVQGVDLDNMVSTPGQTPVCPQTGEILANAQDQARLGLENVKATVVIAGLSVGDIIKMTVSVADLNDFAAINKVYKQFFDEHQATYPTRSCVQVARLPKDVKLKIEAIAVRNAQGLVSGAVARSSRSALPNGNPRAWI